jgi:hypothetical protein
MHFLAYFAKKDTVIALFYSQKQHFKCLPHDDSSANRYVNGVFGAFLW